MLAARLLPLRASDLCSRALVLIFSVVLPVPVCSQSTTKFSYLCLAKHTKVDLVRQFRRLLDIWKVVLEGVKQPWRMRRVNSQ